ncbi:MAG TPA: hypothetical protein VMZ53_26790, partial [Kofleriaceae bacterium]|nr:hypothetical protein [Kofleriaceae bacterium]
PDVPAERQKEVNEEIDRLKGRVGSVTIQTAPGAEILIDDVAVGFAPLPEPVVVSAGQHRIVVHVQGRDPLQRVYDVAGRQELTVSMGQDLAPSAPVVKDTAPVTAVTKQDEAPSKTPIYVTWTITGAFAAGAITFAWFARSDSHKLETLRNTYPVTPEQLQDQKDKAVRDAAIADGLMAATLVTAGIATYFTLTRRDSKKAEKSVQLRVGPGAIGIAGAF